jgi:hypothetical protein
MPNALTRSQFPSAAYLVARSNSHENCEKRTAGRSQAAHLENVLGPCRPVEAAMQYASCHWSGSWSREAAEQEQKHGRLATTSPALSSGCSGQEASTRPRTQNYTRGRAQRSSAWATAPACLAELKSTDILTIAHRMSSDSRTNLGSLGSFFLGGSLGLVSFRTPKSHDFSHYTRTSRCCHWIGLLALLATRPR